MSETLLTDAAPAEAAAPATPAKPRRRAAASTTAAAPKRRAHATAKRSGIDLSEFKSFLGTLGMVSEPIVHVNGAYFPNCVLTVDFGQPLVRPNKLTVEQSSDFVGRLRKLTRDVMAREVNVRVSNDGATGIYWTSAS